MVGGLHHHGSFSLSAAVDVAAGRKEGDGQRAELSPSLTMTPYI